jgi:pyruvate/oxaloacetate carboxyltransferase
MKEISFVDQTLRDSQQSLWGYMMRTDHMTPIAEMMDKVGYRAIATVGSQAFTVGEDQDPFPTDNQNPSSRVLSDRKPFLL